MRSANATRPTVGSLFSGIGGLDLGLEWAGFRALWFCERDHYSRAVLAKHWPGVPCFGDVRDIGEDAPGVDLLAAGFPCQPVSLAGRQRGQDDERWLWPEVARLVRILRPRAVLLENVANLLRLGFDAVISDLAASGYDAEWDCIPAAAVGAPHLRDRVFIIASPGAELAGAMADADNARDRSPVARGDERGPAAHNGRPEQPLDKLGGYGATVADAERIGQPGPGKLGHARDPAPGRQGPTTHALDGGFGNQWTAEPDVGRVADGIPHRVDRLRGLGNAVVPQVAELVGHRVLEILGQPVAAR